MKAIVTVANDGRIFDVPDGEIVLDAALKQGIALPYQCRGASCGTCKARVLEGAVDHGWSFGLALSDDEKAEGLALLCQSRAITPTLTVETLQPIPGAAPRIVETEATVVALQDEGPRVRRLVLRSADRMTFPAGSYAELVLPGVAIDRMYSFASACSGERGHGLLDFYVGLHPQGQASGYVHERLRVGDPVRVRGPFGTCALPAGDGPVLCIAGGTGLAPVLSIVEDALAREPGLSIDLLFSVRRNDDAFALDRLHRLGADHPSFRFDLTVTDEPPRPAIAAHGELVTTLLPARHPDLSRHRIVMGGAPGMIDACLAVLATLGADPARVSYDKFTPVPTTTPEAAMAVV